MVLNVLTVVLGLSKASSLTTSKPEDAATGPTSKFPLRCLGFPGGTVGETCRMLRGPGKNLCHCKHEFERFFLALSLLPVRFLILYYRCNMTSQPLVSGGHAYQTVMHDFFDLLRVI